MTLVALSMHGHSHAETHYFCDEANKVPTVLRFRDVLLRDEPLISSPSVFAPEACRQFHAHKAAHQLTQHDILIVVVQGNLSDDDNDEYFSVSHLDYDDVKDHCPGIGIVSLFYRMSQESEFAQPRTELVQLRKAEWWDPKTEIEKKMLLSNSLLLIVLGLTAVLLTGLPGHSDIRGCIMDYCQDSYDIVEAFRRGVEFRFCDHQCHPFLERTDEGKALLEIAKRLTARPFGQPQPSIFISYARDNLSESERLFSDLRAHFGERHVWKDVYEILGGVEWEPEIRAAMRKHHFVVLCFSDAAVSRPRFFQEEARIALQLHQSKLLHLIPVRFDECSLPHEMAPYHYIDLYPDWAAGIETILKTVTRLWRPFDVHAPRPDEA